MKTSQIGLDLIKFFESLHDGNLKKIGLQPKMCPAGVWTEGYGRAMRDEKGNFIKGASNKQKAYANISIHTIADAELALIEDVNPFELQVIRKLKIDLKQNQFDALVCHFYNTGGSSTLMQMVNENNPDLKKWWEKHYITANGKQLKGLVNRRKAETKLFFL